MLIRNYQAKKLIKLVTFSFLIIGCSNSLVACGNKGDLYLPEKGSVNDSKTNKVKKKS